MKLRRLVLLSALALVATLPAASGAAAAPPGSAATDQFPGRAIVQFAPGTSLKEGRSVAAATDATVLREIPRTWVKDGSRTVVVTSATQDSEALVAALRADPAVEYAEPDYVVHTVATPNDAHWGDLWGMAKISAPAAWNTSTGSSSVVIASTDTGVDYTHPDLAANMWHNPGETAGNGKDDDGNGYIDDVYGIDTANGDSDPQDDDGHGTHTAGTVAAVGNNGLGVAGVCWTARIMALKFIGADGTGQVSDAIDLINYAVAEKNSGVNVVAINASWAGGDYSSLLKNAVDAAGAAGIVFIAAAGNENANNDVTPSYPAALTSTNLIAVAATDASDKLSVWDASSASNYGALSVDLAAPGTDVLSTYPGGLYAWSGGTSMAAPHVTGAVALCAAAYPGETVAQRKARILDSVDAVAALQGKCVTGGRLNVAAAVGGAVKDTTPPTTSVSGIPGGWANSPVTAVFNATDSQSGVAYTEYRLDGGTWTKAARVTISTTGVHSLEYRSADNEGNVEAARSVTVRVDTTPPVTTVTGADDAWHTTSVELSFAVADAHSGVAYVEYSTSGGSSWTRGAALTVTASGTTTVYYRAADNTGNVEAAKSVAVRIDKAAPVTTVTGADAAWHKAPVTLNFSATGGPSGVARTEWSTDGGDTWTQGTTAVISGDGAITVRYRSVSGAGAAETAQQVIVKVARTRPRVAARDASVKRGKKVTIKFRVSAVTPRAAVTILVRKNNKTRITKRYTAVATNTWQSRSFTVNLLKGTYQLRVNAVDQAGNTQAASGQATLRVK